MATAPGFILLPQILPLTTLAAIFIACSLITVICFLYLKEYHLRRRADQRSIRISQETQEKALELYSAAQSAETKILEESDSTTKGLERQLQEKMDTLIKSSTESADKAQKQLYDFLGELKNTALSSQAESQRSVETRINEMFERLETRLSDFLIKTEQNTTSAIELELRSARNLIESYKSQQLALIDENILAMMEQTLNIVLSKKLNLRDQLDLVYEALEKAKAEKFLV